jgi:mono/diheme cytochrome c family protein
LKATTRWPSSIHLLAKSLSENFMDPLFWQRMHGGSTHFPIVLLMASVAFDVIGWRFRDESLRRGLHAAGFASAIIGLLGGVGAVVSGLVMSRGVLLGKGFEKSHHLFVWPAFAMCTALVLWRLLRSGWFLQAPPRAYLAGMSVAAGLMMGAGYWGGEMLLGAEGRKSPTTGPERSSAISAVVARGRDLFLLNCAHCHGADARGDEGPDLHRENKSDTRMAALIREGIPGEMPRFSSKLSNIDVQALITYIRSLH